MDNQKDKLKDQAGFRTENHPESHAEDSRADGPDREELIVIRKPGKKTVKKLAAAAAALAVLLAAAAAGEELLERRLERREDAAVEKMLRARAEADNVSLISREDAVSTALRLAEASEQDVKRLDVRLDSHSGYNMDGGSPGYIYEVGFTYNGFEYDLDIDAVSGWVVSSDVESAAD